MLKSEKAAYRFYYIHKSSSDKICAFVGYLGQLYAGLEFSCCSGCGTERGDAGCHLSLFKVRASDRLYLLNTVYLIYIGTKLVHVLFDLYGL